MIGPAGLEQPVHWEESLDTAPRTCQDGSMTNTDDTHKTRTGTATISKGRLLQLLAEEIGHEAREDFDEEVGISIGLDAIFTGSLIEGFRVGWDGGLEVEYSFFYYGLNDGLDIG